MDFFIKGLRTFLWLFVQAFGWFADKLYETILSIATFDFMNIKFKDTYIMWELWKATIVLTVIATIIRILKLVIDLYIDVEKSRKSFQSFKKLISIIFVVIMLSAVPVLMQGVGRFSKEVISNVHYFVGFEQDIKPTTVMIGLVSNKNSDKFNLQDEQLKIEEIDINKKTSWIGGSFVYFPELFDILILATLMGFAAFIMGAIALDIGKRLYELVKLILIAFIPISAMIEDNSLIKKWSTSIFNIYLSNFFELYSFFISFVILGALSSVGANAFVLIVMYIAGLLSILNGSDQIARLLGVETASNTLSQLSNLSQVARGFSPITAAKVMASDGQKALSFLGRQSDKIVGNTFRGTMNALGGVGARNYGKSQYNISKETNPNSRPESYMDRFKTGFSYVDGNSNTNIGSTATENSFNSSSSSGNGGQFSERHSVSSSFTPLYEKGSKLYNFQQNWQQSDNAFKRGISKTIDNMYEKSLKYKKARRGWN